MKLWKILHILLLVEFSIEGMYENEYCNLNCGKNHTLCKRKGCPPNPNCGSYYANEALTDEEIMQLLEELNSVRQEVARGSINYTQAANMKVVSYGRELEFIAQCWANECKEFQMDNCRSTVDFEDVNQKIYVMYDLRENRQVDCLFNAISNWRNEKEFVQPQWLKRYPGYIYARGSSFIQLIWATVHQIGCGRIVYGDDNKGKICLLVCNFAPGGMQSLEPVFMEGTPCSKCPPGLSCGSEYRHLCGEIIRADTFVPPFSFSKESSNLLISNLQARLFYLVVLFYVACGGA